MKRQGHKILAGTVTGYLSNGRMNPPRTHALRKAYYREARRLTRAAGRRLREHRRALRRAFPPPGPGAIRFLGPATFSLGGCDYEVKAVAMTWEGRGRRSRPVFTTLGPATVTWPAS